MRVIFMGTPEFAVKSLKAIHSEFDLVGIYTKVDKPNTRGKKIKYNPVKQYGIKNNIPVYQPESVRDEETLREIKKLAPDMIVVVAYGKILPQELIDIPKKGIVNVHSSLLPKFRGAAPIHAAIISGEKETGVTIMDIAEELDAGDIILQGKTPISDEDNLATLHDRLAIIGSEKVVEAMKLIEEGKATRREQEHEKATFIRTIRKDECEVHWEDTMDEVFNFIRGLNPFPCAYTMVQDKILKVYSVERYPRTYEGKIGEVVDLIKGKGPVIKVGDGAIIITEGKPANKRVISGSDLVNGNYLKLGEVLSCGKTRIRM